MKKIGLIGGMSWESTLNYYQIINETVNEELGGLHSAQCILYSLDFQEIETLQSANNWDACAAILGEAAKKLEQSGADVILICSNTMHKVAPQISAQIKIPLLHIAEVTAKAIKRKNLKKVALFGTKYTMPENFYPEILKNHQIEMLKPDPEDITRINDIIFNELCFGLTTELSKEVFFEIIRKLDAQGAEGFILGCTEIGMLLQQNDSPWPLFDTTIIHATEAALWSIETP